MAIIGLIASVGAIMIIFSFHRWATHHESSKDQKDWGVFLYGMTLMLVGWIVSASPVGEAANTWIASSAPGWFPRQAPEDGLVKIIDPKVDEPVELLFDAPLKSLEWIVRIDGQGPQVLQGDSIVVPLGPRFVEVYYRSKVTGITSPVKFIVIR